MSNCGITDLGDDLAGLTLLPLGRLHGFRDRADAVDAARLLDAFRILERTVHSLDEQP